MVEAVIDEVPVAETPTPLIANRAYDSDKLRTNLLATGRNLICPLAEAKYARPRRTAES